MEPMYSLDYQPEVRGFRKLCWRLVVSRVSLLQLETRLAVELLLASLIIREVLCTPLSFIPPEPRGVGLLCET